MDLRQIAVFFAGLGVGVGLTFVIAEVCFDTFRKRIAREAARQLDILREEMNNLVNSYKRN